ncbi:uncharacterized protein C14orf132 [Hypomesus transpacificus]|uniref:uncharacterized protein C14orf132 n=1 Tax=Hypomesus transpacificus TaxID=137520 RepID=UPI001F084CA7|nr:uncharacterized protein C14orf132 [Hypomesus transpacificus]
MKYFYLKACLLIQWLIFSLLPLAWCSLALSSVHRSLSSTDSPPLSPHTHFPAVSGAFMDSPYNGNTSLQTSTSNLNASFSRPPEPEDNGKVSSETIWLWVAVIATIGNIVVVAVVCACAF